MILNCHEQTSVTTYDAAQFLAEVDHFSTCSENVVSKRETIGGACLYCCLRS